MSNASDFLRRLRFLQIWLSPIFCGFWAHNAEKSRFRAYKRGVVGLLLEDESLQKRRMGLHFSDMGLKLKTPTANHTRQPSAGCPQEFQRNSCTLHGEAVKVS